MSQELIVALVNHRKIGRLFQVFNIEQTDNYYKVVHLVRGRDIPSLNVTEEQKKLILLAESISDEELTKRFSKKLELTKFINNLDENYFKEHINPFIDKQLNAIIKILMNGNTRLFQKQDKYSNLYEEDIIKVSPSYMDVRMVFNRDVDGIRYKLQLRAEGVNFPLLYKKPHFLVMRPAAFIYRNVLYCFKNLESTKIIPFLSKKEVFIPQSAEDKYLNSFVKNCIAEYRVKVSGFQLMSNRAEKEVHLNLEEDLMGNYVLSPIFKYGELSFDADNKQEVAVDVDKDGDNYRFIRTVRDLSWEQGVCAKLEELGLQKKNGFYKMKGIDVLSEEDANLNLMMWLNEHQSDLNDCNMVYHRSEEIKDYCLEKGELNLEVVETDDWFDLRGVVKFGKYEIPFIRLRRHILNKIREFELPNGEIVVLPKEWFATYSDIISFSEEEEGELRVEKHHFTLLGKEAVAIDKNIISRFKNLSDKSIEVELPENIKANLRSYQHEGFSWLYGLYEHKFGACLADDMGLGKTLQTISLLLKLKRKENKEAVSTELTAPRTVFDEISQVNAEVQQSQAASLIVLPTSLMHNWRNEIEKFAPDLKVCSYYGSQRSKLSSFRSLSNMYDVILTTYGTVRNDINRMKELEFFYIILDESQYIKNPNSKIYRAITELQSKHKLVLTGTPIENSLSDLWAQMNFINPGLLGNLNFFKREFLTPIEKKADQEKQEKLKLLIRPFILRRTKLEVAQDLPPVTEQVRYCDMSSEQHDIYEKEKSVIRKDLLETIEQRGIAKSSMLILQGLTRLRQLANHPKMLGFETNSGKFDTIIETLTNLIKENHKVLIFSSFVRHLSLIEDYMKEQGLEYSLLTGQTPNREAVIEDFQSKAENKVFLISLKAGGVGLNLTQADYVFILDPWWNPAAEMQAISRAHRIGQNKKVMVYRFITEESIEEKILNMQRRKSVLADKFINSNNPFEGVSSQDIVKLFS